MTEVVGPFADLILYWDIEKNGGKILELPEALMCYRTHVGREDRFSDYKTFQCTVRLFNFLTLDSYYKIPLQNYRQAVYDRYYIRAMFKYFRGSLSENQFFSLKNDFQKCLNITRSKWDIFEKFVKIYLALTKRKISQA